MKRLVFFSLLSALVLFGCNLTVGVDVQSTATQAAVIVEPTAVRTSTATNPPLPSPTAEPSASPTSEPTAAYMPELTAQAWIAYVGADGNLWLGNPASGENKQLTQDAHPWSVSPPGETIVEYAHPQWSSDGKLLGYTRQVSTPKESGYDIRTGLWFSDLVNAPRQLVEESYVIGFAWKPSTTLIAYGKPIDLNYYGDQAGYAQGIWAVDASTGESYELVPPIGGRSLVLPQWSPDGRFLAFDEVLYMEGRGNFAYYDFEAQQYFGWEQPIGDYTWLPDGQQLAYDYLTYTAQGTERIWLNDRQGKSEIALSPEGEPGYAFMPVFSPNGDRLAYLASLNGPENTIFTLFVLDLSGGEPKNLGEFEQVWTLSWSPDGKWLAVNAGPYDQQNVLVVSIADGASQVLDRGTSPAWQPEK